MNLGGQGVLSEHPEMFGFRFLYASGVLGEREAGSL